LKDLGSFISLCAVDDHTEIRMRMETDIDLLLLMGTIHEFVDGGPQYCFSSFSLSFQTFGFIMVDWKMSDLPHLINLILLVPSRIF